MNSIDILVSEHDNIKKVIKVIRKLCFQLTNGMEVPYDDFFQVIDFIRNYADKYHHGKEEDMLFIDMNNELQETIGEGPIQGMLIEHNFGRSLVMDLEVALNSHKSGDKEAIVDIIGNAIGYANLLTKHINKEDNMIYKYATNNLKKETLDKLDIQFKEFEENSAHIEVKNKYIKFVNELESKYS
ncbi:hemerythrin HHE cation binding domain-containing protein [Gottschalkia acidurici 9a]|uniref:Hemerythrin HHE cation binding domain-containing protein n=1 Tax=Gottschalkia acidurici (strain ATCC 7906 / DSM 604 / BCRC 14475 / CIP 104303 / KCTC 5404 / NCIMB 10678 / 9a) TaxID=1128398 RepID=K0AY80_GOTA9|nr:hemerythrin domain-containing protein [Gottschalkia acidurici]AFS77715.1 hemerythrin HHE cation binding domain-containing protein [Gottschalkia acidurici 9a]